MHLDWIDIAGGIAVLVSALGSVAFAGVKLGAALQQRRNGIASKPPQQPQPPDHQSGEYPGLATTDYVERALDKVESRIECRLDELSESSGKRFDSLEDQVRGISRNLAELTGEFRASRRESR